VQQPRSTSATDFEPGQPSRGPHPLPAYDKSTEWSCSMVLKAHRHVPRLSMERPPIATANCALYLACREQAARQASRALEDTADDAKFFNTCALSPGIQDPVAFSRCACITSTLLLLGRVRGTGGGRGFTTSHARFTPEKVGDGLIVIAKMWRRAR